MTLNIAKFKKNLTVNILCRVKGYILKSFTSEVHKSLIKNKNRLILLDHIDNHLLKFNVINKIDVINTGVTTEILQWQ